MPVVALEHTPITPRRGGLVHAVTLSNAKVTACGRKFSGWIVALRPLTCIECKRAIFFPTKGQVTS